MNENDDAVRLADKVFSNFFGGVDHTFLYHAMDRHGLLEWAVQIKPPHGWDTYLTLGIWQVHPRETVLGVRASVAQIRGNAKYVRDFSDRVTIADAHSPLETLTAALLNQALDAAGGDLTEDPSTKLPDLYEFAGARRATGR